MTVMFSAGVLRACSAAALAAALFCSVPSDAQTPAPAPTAVAPSAAVSAAGLPQPPEVAARAYLLVDVTAGQVLAAKDADSPVEQASLTKLMTAYIVFDALRAKKIDLQQKLPVSERAWKMPGSRMFIDPKMQVPVDDLLKGMIVQSGNDATVALAEGVAGSVDKFVQLMNTQAKALGMTRTAYKNPEGLTEAGHTTSANDLAKLATALMREFPQYLPYYAIKTYRYPGTPAANETNRNLLLFRDATVDGLKTGHTEAAGYCLIATAKRSFPNLPERRLLSIVLGTANENARANESQKLLNWGYTAWDGIKLFDAGQTVVAAPVWKGAKASANLGSPQALVVAVPRGEATAVRTRISRPDPLFAPLTQGQAVGKLEVSVGERPLASLPLTALEPVAQAGWFGRAWDAVRLWIK
jgi:serine-type D-Ala-D-Ala carboxypeptidase (penicillin-binding protein 5/6)